MKIATATMQRGANIAGFKKVGDAVPAFGVVSTKYVERFAMLDRIFEKLVQRAGRNIFAACVFMISAANAHAHDFWIEADNFTPQVGEDVAVSLNFGVGFEGGTLPFANAMIEEFSVTDNHGRKNIDSEEGNDPVAIIEATKGAQLLGYQSKPQYIELDAVSFEEYAREEGIEYILEERERRGESNDTAPENFIRCAKALIRTLPETQSVFNKELGFTLELIPQSDPYQLSEGENIEFVVLYQGKPAHGLQVQALANTAPNEVQKVRTDNNGMASVSINKQGVWLIKVVLIVPLAQRQQLEGIESAQWQSYWASYVFEL